MYNVLENFWANPCADTFEKIRYNSCLLTKVFREEKDIAKAFFGFAEWFLIKKETANLDAKEKIIVQENLKSTISCFDDAIKYYYSLGYNDRIAWQKDFISYATTMKSLQSALSLVGKEYRKEIVEKMREIAITDKEKQIAFSYVI